MGCVLDHRLNIFDEWIYGWTQPESSLNKWVTYASRDGSSPGREFRTWKIPAIYGPSPPARWMDYRHVRLKVGPSWCSLPRGWLYYVSGTGFPLRGRSGSASARGGPTPRSACNEAGGCSRQLCETWKDLRCPMIRRRRFLPYIKFMFSRWSRYFLIKFNRLFNKIKHVLT